MENKGLGIIEILIIIALAGMLAVLCARCVKAEPVPMHLTCYCPESCPGTLTYTGAHVREGIAAVTQEHIGDCAMIYTVSGDLIGYYECLDKIGTGKSTVIDVWKPDLESAREMMKKTEGKVLVEFFKSPKG